MKGDQIAWEERIPAKPLPRATAEDLHRLLGRLQRAQLAQAPEPLAGHGGLEHDEHPEGEERVVPVVVKHPQQHAEHLGQSRGVTCAESAIRTERGSRVRGKGKGPDCHQTRTGTGRAWTHLEDEERRRHLLLHQINHLGQRDVKGVGPPFLEGCEVVVLRLEPLRPASSDARVCIGRGGGIGGLSHARGSRWASLVVLGIRVVDRELDLLKGVPAPVQDILDLAVLERDLNGLLLRLLRPLVARSTELPLRGRRRGAGQAVRGERPSALEPLGPCLLERDHCAGAVVQLGLDSDMHLGVDIRRVPRVQSAQELRVIRLKATRPGWLGAPSLTAPARSTPSCLAVLDGTGEADAPLAHQGRQDVEGSDRPEGVARVGQPMPPAHQQEAGCGACRRRSVRVVSGSQLWRGCGSPDVRARSGGQRTTPCAHPLVPPRGPSSALKQMMIPPRQDAGTVCPLTHSIDGDAVERHKGGKVQPPLLPRKAVERH